MKIQGVSTGVDFERYVQNLLNRPGMNVYDTPVTNDYGADLVLEYKSKKICIQCKYYSSQVGIKAIQEAIGSLTYYNADYAAVVTNASFTQQAENLAQTNAVLLVDGSELLNLSNMIDTYIEKGVSEQHQAKQDWLMRDLVVRYGVSSQKIYKDFLNAGLPYTKVGREYHFNSEEVIEWEIHKKSIPFGKNDKIVLPGYTQFKKDVASGIKEAKKADDQERVKELKALAKSKGVNIYEKQMLAAAVIILFSIAAICIAMVL